MNHVESGTQLHHLHHNRITDHSDLPLLDADECSSDQDGQSPKMAHRPRTSLTNTDDTHQSLLNTSTNSNDTNNNSNSLSYSTRRSHNHVPPLNLQSNTTTLTNLSNNNNGSLMMMNNNLMSNSLPNTMHPNMDVAEQQKKFARRPSLGEIELGKGQKKPEWPRLVAKNGECMVRPIHNQSPYLSLYRNWFHLLIEYSWRSVISVFAAGFVLSWLFFGLIYYLIVHFSGDLQRRPEHKQCIANVHSFIGAFLFSLESQQTIGYGSRYMTEICPPAFIILSLQIVVGLLLQTMLAGIVVAKVLRPKKRKQEMRFSQNAVIGPIDEDDQRPTLMVRIADIQQKLYLAESHVRMYMAKTRINAHGAKELIGFRDMNVGYDSGWDRVLLLWPIIIRHIIDEDSPLYGMTPEEMESNDFEIIMTVEGIVEATGATFQARTSFLPFEIEWGRRFTPMVHLNSKRNEYEVDYGLFDVTDPLADYVPRISAQIKDELERYEDEEEEEEHKFHNKSGFT
ncbi:unnamed protein product [Bursaphelenchus okinawaensis]|uniref:IRK_C domain-containing protein n=1 Tax=Bursaphelenchus okinawaensis TaxID=465554 RepID=A0A811LTZ1_9BILA|nr:unnamed protein product [Bursaphelenchus okinawaensis]CAG9127810.1 unnamed protein product [Bursaphelenchus okinawaensis]